MTDISPNITVATAETIQEQNSYDVYTQPSLQPADALNQGTLSNSLDGAFINGAQQIQRGSIFSDKLVIGSQGWLSNLVFTATDYRTCSWGSGSIQTADGHTYSISAGNTGAMTNPTWIYFDKLASASGLQITTTYSNAVGDNKIILAYAAPVTNITSLCVISVFAGPGTTIDGNKIVTGKITSANGLTFFDLDNNLIEMSDGTNPRVVIKS